MEETRSPHSELNVYYHPGCPHAHLNVKQVRRCMNWHLDGAFFGREGIDFTIVKFVPAVELT